MIFGPAKSTTDSRPLVWENYIYYKYSFYNSIELQIFLFFSLREKKSTMWLGHDIVGYTPFEKLGKIKKKPSP